MIRDFLTGTYIFPLAILLGFLFPALAEGKEFLLIPIIIVMLSLSLKDLAFTRFFERPSPTTIRLVAMSYVLLTGMTALGAIFMVQSVPYTNAMLMFALMPPAILVVSLSYLYDGDMKEAFTAEVLTYLAALIIIPGASYLLFRDVVQPFKLFESVALVILLPLFLSRLVRYVDQQVYKLKKENIKIAITFLVGSSAFIIIGVNRELLFTDLRDLILVGVLIVLLRFGIGTLVFMLTKNADRKMRPLYVLFATLKNGNAAAAFTVLLFSEQALVPFAMNAVIDPFYLIFTEWLLRDPKKTKEGKRSPII